MRSVIACFVGLLLSVKVDAERDQTFLLPGGVEMEFVWIEPGVFQMGSSDTESYLETEFARRMLQADLPDQDNEMPLHEVEISRGFWLGKYEVTQGQWESVGRNPSEYKGDDRLPVERVSWDDVHAFIGVLNAAAGDSLYRLPTEAEWEYACRAGTTTHWSFGDNASRLRDYAWHIGEGHFGTKAVGQKLPNGWGLYDMHGNVAEWVQDWLDDYYDSSPRVDLDPQGPSSGSRRVLRGGSFSSGGWHGRSAARNAATPHSRGRFIGVRLVRVDPPVEVEESEVFSLPGGGEMEFVWIEPGVFQMGSPESEQDRQDDEGPLHEVEISKGFWLGKYEVTQGEWESVMGSNPSRYEVDSRYPVVEVSWYDVHAFIGALNAAAGDSLYRLPTEAEWEYACRAGTTTRWSFGDDERRLGHYAWHDDDISTRLKAVGQRLPNGRGLYGIGWGLYDMHGNVAEWVQDWYDEDYYNSSPRIDPPGPSSGFYRVVRSGAFLSNAQDVRSANRSYHSPGLRDGSVGVRLLRIR